MPLPGKPPLTASEANDRRRRDSAGGRLSEAREREHAGCVSEALERYQAAVDSAERDGNAVVLAEALRRQAIIRHHQNDSEYAGALCRRSYDVARSMGHNLLAAEALNTLGGIALTTGRMADARVHFEQARELAGGSRVLTAKVEQNLGILANIQGDFEEATSSYRRSLEAYDAARDEHGCAIAYNNMGLVSADRGQWDKAHRYFRESRAIAERVGDLHLRALCLVNEAEVDTACQRFEHARQGAEEALGVFEQLGVQGAKSDAYRVIGIVHRETGRMALAEARLRTACDVAVAAGSVLMEAEARREMALLYQVTGRNHDALRELERAYRLFRNLDARSDLVYVAGKLAELEGTYLMVVREWGRSMEANDPATFGHCERVARLAVAVARAMKLDAQSETTVLLGAYLQDVGMVRVSPGILAKAGPLSGTEQSELEMHPVYGVELLMDVDFPWDIKPIIRWHHERCDGSGYPDHLAGNDVPLLAQIVGIAETWDALMRPRHGEPALRETEASARIAECRAWWSEPVVNAFLQTVGQVASTPAPEASLNIERTVRQTLSRSVQAMG